MEPIEQDLMPRVPEMIVGGIAAIAGLIVWLAAGWYKQNLEKRTKK